MKEERFLRHREVTKITGLTKPTIYRFMTQGKFPRPINLGEKMAAWLLSDIQKWMEEKINAAREAKH